MIFWNLSIVTVLLLALIKLLRVIMMSKSQKVIPQKVSLWWKYLKNNGDSSFQNLAEKLFGCHDNKHES